MENVKKTIFITTSFEGVHCYPSAPEGVEFLASPHRHMFGITAEIEVYHDDRELEFILFKRLINHWLAIKQNAFGVWEMGAMSCEMVARWLIDKIQSEVARGKERYLKITVNEDGENGATVEVVPSAPKQNKKATTEEAPSTMFPMTLNEYQVRAYQNIQEHKSHQEEVMHWAIGLGEEAGETLSVIKHKYYGGGYDVADLVSELGDTLWHVAALCTVLGISMEDVAHYNLAKLEHRYPNGAFDHARSAYREAHDIEFKESEAFRKVMNKIAHHYNGGKEDERF